MLQVRLGLGDRLGGERRHRRDLRQHRRADGEVAGQAVHRAAQLGGHHQPAQPPACHREILRKAVDDDGITRRLPGAAGRWRPFVDQAVVNLVADELDAGGVAPGSDRRQFLGRYDRSGGIGRAGDDDALHRRVEFGEHLRGGLEPGLRPARDLDHLTSQCGQDVSIARVAGAGHRHPVADVEAGQKCQQKTARRAGGDYHGVRLDADAVLALVIRGDRGTQLWNAQCHGVTQLVEMQGGRGGGAHRFRGARAGLSGRQVHQVAVATLTFRGRQPDIHHIKRWDAGAQRDTIFHDCWRTSDSSRRSRSRGGSSSCALP